MERKYSIYRLTSPSGRCYIGLTGQSVVERWRNHVTFSKKNIHHPLYCAIRKYGFESFTVETIASELTLQEANEREIAEISAHKIQGIYNISAGGSNDDMGGKVFWARIKQDPHALAEYLAKLSETKRDRDWSDYPTLAKKALNWRKENPREAWKMSYRALRLANKANAIKYKDLPEKIDPRTRKERLMSKYNVGEFRRRSVAKHWAGMSAEAKQERSANISKSLKAKNVNKTPEERMSMVAKARQNIDRSIQGPAASKGIKTFWENLRKDPSAYEAHINQRKQTLAETNRKKKCERTI
jgi:hypothetical protein